MYKGPMKTKDVRYITKISITSHQHWGVPENVVPFGSDHTYLDLRLHWVRRFGDLAAQGIRRHDIVGRQGISRLRVLVPQD